MVFKIRVFSSACFDLDKCFVGGGVVIRNVGSWDSVLEFLRTGVCLGDVSKVIIECK